jgi:hypothetical protein
LNGSLYIYDGFADTPQKFDAAKTFTAPLASNSTAFYVIAPIGRSGIAFFGDAGKFVGTGKQRIASMRDEKHRLTVETVFAENESEVILHGCADSAPKVTARHGKTGEVKYDDATRHFTVKIIPDPSRALDKSEADPVRHVTVVFNTR